MCKILAAVFTLNSYLESSCLSIAQIRAGTYLEVLLLSGAPCFNVTALYFQVSQVARTALKSTYRDIQRTEEVNRVLPQLVIPCLAVFRLADNDHFLLLELVYTVYTSLLDAVSTYFLTETRRIAGQCLGQLCLGQSCLDELAYHGVLGSTYKIQILALDLVHHVLHLSEAHNACNNAGSYHERRYIVSKSPVDHEISCIGEYSRVKSCDIALEIIETVARCLTRSVKVDAVESLHNIYMIGNFKIGNNRLAELFDLNVLAVVLAYGHAVVDDVGDHQHSLADLSFQLFFLDFKVSELLSHSIYLSLYSLSLFLLTLAHQSAYLLALYISLISQFICLGTCSSVFLIEFSDFVNQYEFFVLELLFNIFFDQLGVGSYKLDIYHIYYSSTQGFRPKFINL